MQSSSAAGTDCQHEGAQVGRLALPRPALSRQQTAAAVGSAVAAMAAVCRAAGNRKRKSD
jgi:hypothetical protein